MLSNGKSHDSDFSRLPELKLDRESETEKKIDLSFSDDESQVMLKNLLTMQRVLRILLLKVIFPMKKSVLLTLEKCCARKLK